MGAEAAAKAKEKAAAVKAANAEAAAKKGQTISAAENAREDRVARDQEYEAARLAQMKAKKEEAKEKRLEIKERLAQSPAKVERKETTPIIVTDSNTVIYCGKVFQKK